MDGLSSMKRFNLMTGLSSMKVKILILLASLFLLQSCDKTDVNGNLDGNWQLTKWVDKETGATIATNESRRLYYTVKYNILQMRDMSKSYDTFHLSYFHYTSDSLFIDQTFHRPFDTEEPLDSLVQYGCTPDGKFAIVTLTGSSLVLSNSKNELTFRKY